MQNVTHKKFIGKLIKYNKTFLWFDVGNGKIKRIPTKDLCNIEGLPIDKDDLLVELMSRQITNAVKTVTTTNKEVA